MRKASSYGLASLPENGGAGGQRKASSFGGMGDENRRRGSAFLDYEQTTKAFLESQSKLGQTSRLLADLEKKHRELQESYDGLSRRFVEVKGHALDCALRYCVDKSGDFEYLPRADADLMETDARAGPYLLHETLGRGQFSTVRLCSRQQDRQGGGERRASNVAARGKGGAASEGPAHAAPRLACKVIPKDGLTSIHAVLSIERELKALSTLPPHANTVRFLECMHGAQALYIVTESLPRDLFELIQTHALTLDANVAAVLVREVAQGLAHIHAHKIAHRDLKPENILVDVRHSHVELRICDFGLCAFLPEVGTTLGDCAGSPGFFAPECQLHSVYCAYRADVFSLGCVALELLAGQGWFHERWLGAYAPQHRDVARFGPLIREATLQAHREVQRRHSPEALELLTSTLHCDPALRLSAKQVLLQAWVAGACAFEACDRLHGKTATRRVAPLPHGLPIVGARVMGSFVGQSQGPRRSQ